MDGMLTPPRALPRVRPDMMAKPLSGKYQGGWERCRGVGMATLSQLSASDGLWRGPYPAQAHTLRLRHQSFFSFPFLVIWLFAILLGCLF